MKDYSLIHKISDRILRDFIHVEKAEKDDKLPSIRNLRQIYGGSTATISHALASLEKRGFVEVRHGKGCFIKKITSKKPKPKKIGFVMPTEPNGTNELINDYFRGITNYAELFGWEVVTRLNGKTIKDEQRAIEKLIREDCKGIVVAPLLRSRKQAANDYLINSKIKVPLVLVGVIPEYAQHYPAAVFDEYQSGFEMTQRMIAAGHTKIAFTTTSPKNNVRLHTVNLVRLDGHMDAYKANGF